MKYQSAPVFSFQTNSVDSSDEDHKKFIDTLTKEGQKLNPKTFVRCTSTIQEKS